MFSGSLADRPKEGSPDIAVIIVYRGDAMPYISNLQKIIDQKYHGSFHIYCTHDGQNIINHQELETWLQSKNNISLHAVDKTTVGKKGALAQAINLVSESWVLCTDIDCEPQTSEWIQRMVDHRSEDVDMVLGVGLLQSDKRSWWSRWIHYDTLDIALNYSLWSRLGRTYMSVGRNVLVRKSWWLAQGGIADHAHVVGGDDDLTIQKASQRPRSTVALHPEAYISSKMPDVLSRYLDAKHRHLDAGRHYNISDQFLLGVRGVAHLLSWALLPVLITQGVVTALIGFIFFIALLYVQYCSFKKIDDAGSSFSHFIFADVLSPFLYIYLSYVTLWNRRTHW